MTRIRCPGRLATTIPSFGSSRGPRREGRRAMARVVVVDGDADLRDTLRMLLEDAGYTVAECDDGLDCLRVLRASPTPLVVLLENLLRRMMGEAVLRAVAADPCLAGRHAYVVLTTSPCALLPHTQHLPAGLSVPVIAKPFELDELLNAVAQAAGRLMPTTC